MYFCSPLGIRCPYEIIISNFKKNNKMTKKKYDSQLNLRRVMMKKT